MSSPEFAMLTEDDLVTGEAVALDLPAATVGARIASGLLDVLALGIVGFVVLFLAIVSSAHTDGALQHVALVGSLMLVFLVYPTVLETLTRGRSLGKVAMGLRVVRDDAGPVTAQQSFVRALIGIVEIYALSGGPAFFSCLVSSRGKRLGDYAAGTYVVRDRVRLALPPPTPMPAHLVGWAATADVRSPPVGLALAVRQYLARVSTLDPASRHRGGELLATRMSEYVAPPPPPGTTSWDFLAAVSATRRQRDAARLSRDDALRARLTARSE
ncbi:RDD family protein [Nocardioides cynanchi]|uniref:RDD family protein n=1 Tax=Nocardioides cynanchi TaxID=2558918 RepID=UPI0012480BBD|nr:RDD family protein [Nocardioides cynanchi]